MRALEDMFPLAKTILKGALARDECRGAHYKPKFPERNDPDCGVLSLRRRDGPDGGDVRGLQHDVPEPNVRVGVGVWVCWYVADRWVCGYVGMWPTG